MYHTCTQVVEAPHPERLQRVLLERETGALQSILVLLYDYFITLLFYYTLIYFTDRGKDSQPLVYRRNKCSQAVCHGL